MKRRDFMAGAGAAAMLPVLPAKSSASKELADFWHRGCPVWFVEKFDRPFGTLAWKTNVRGRKYGCTAVLSPETLLSTDKIRIKEIMTMNAKRSIDKLLG